ncbi:hypothetical protein MAM1_0006d00778 [Mucor ambiguus]|uniref:Uncharacterized protein n=1 Tax=Mucor ambiguus TaxID=91626 RepID=A0A0C9LQA3_9FUNG|nr:hypothetical protein MAM1_0006d00778 [Mucor ambiguus]
MPPCLLLNDSNAIRRVILEQTKHIECLKHQLEEYERDSLAKTASSSPSLVFNASTTSSYASSITSCIVKDSIVKVEYDEPAVPSDRNRQPLSTLPSVKSEESIQIPSASPYTPQRINVLLLQGTALPPLKTTLKLNQLPKKRTFKRRIKAAVELDGYNRDTHFQHLIYQDSTLPPRTRNARWNFAFRFCSYFVFSGRKILAKTLIHGNKGDNKKTSIDSFSGLHAFLRLKRIDAALLENPLSEETVTHFTNTKHQLEIVKFLYAFCSLLYAFLPQENRVYRVRSNVSDFCLSANVKTLDQQVEEEDEKEIKEEVDPDSDSMKSDLKAEYYD